MSQFRKKTRVRTDFRFLDASGQGLAEYLIIVVLIAIIVIVGIRYFGSGVKGQFQNATEEVANVRDGDTSAVPKAGAASRSAARGSAGGVERGGGADLSSGDSGSADGGEGGDKKGGGAEGGEDDELGSQISELRAGEVGDTESSPISKIEISWGFLLTVGGVLVLFAIAFLFKEMKDKEGGGDGGGEE